MRLSSPDLDCWLGYKCRLSDRCSHVQAELAPESRKTSACFFPSLPPPVHSSVLLMLGTEPRAKHKLLH